MKVNDRHGSKKYLQKLELEQTGGTGKHWVWEQTPLGDTRGTGECGRGLS